MLPDGYYIIRPADALKNRLVQLNSDLTEILCETLLWKHSQACITEGCESADLAEVKLLFLANLMNEYLPVQQYEKLLGEPCLSAEIFDKWWSIERYFLDDVFEDIEERIPSAISSLFVKTGLERVDLWIDKMQNRN